MYVMNFRVVALVFVSGFFQSLALFVVENGCHMVLFGGRDRE